LQTLCVTLPAVITTDLRLNNPRYPALPLIMQAKRKPLEIIALESLSIDISPHQEIVRVTTPPKRQMGVRVHDVAELLDKLQHEAKVL